MAIDTIKFKRGVKSKLNNLSYGEPAYISDEGELYIGTKSGVEKLTRNKEVKELSSQLEHIINENEKVLNVECYENLITNDDWSTAIEYCLNNLSNSYSRIILPNRTIKTSNISLDSLSNVILEFQPNTILKNIDGKQDCFITISNCSNITLNNVKIDGGYSYYRGIAILKGNSNININSIEIRNISPIIQDNPLNINSVGILIANSTNKNINIENIYIDGVKNNNNGVIGDSIGSSRGILIDVVDKSEVTEPLKNVRLRNINIKNIYCEDADGIQIIGSNLKQDVEMENILIDNCQSRGLKYQNVYGTTLRNVKIKHTDRTFNMRTGISLYSPNNNIDNCEIDVKAIKGVDMIDYECDYPSVLSNFRITMSNDELIDGSKVYGVDLYNNTSKIFNNLRFNNFYISTGGGSICIRGNTKDCQFNNITCKSNKGSFAFNVLSAFTHNNLDISNLICDNFGIYAENTVIFNNCLCNGFISRNNKNPYFYLTYISGFKIGDNFISERMPTTGSYTVGDYVKNTNIRGLWDSKLSATKYVKGWLRITTGESHVLGTDWKEDYII